MIDAKSRVDETTQCSPVRNMEFSQIVHGVFTCSKS